MIFEWDQGRGTAHILGSFKIVGQFGPSNSQENFCYSEKIELYQKILGWSHSSAVEVGNAALTY